MLRLWLLVLVALSLAACSSAPPRSTRGGGSTYGGENTQRTMPPGSPRFVDHSIGREEISIEAMSLIGIPYRWGGNTPDSGFDCSGLVRYIVGRAANVDLPRTTADISRRGESIDPDEIAPGDLIFFNTTGRAHSHVGIYVGKLRFVNAPSTGGTVRLDYLTNPYWAKRFDGIRRVAPPLKAPSPFDAPTELAAPRSPIVPIAPVAPTAPDTPAAAPPVRTAVAAASARPSVSPVPPAPTARVSTAATAARSEDPIDAAADAFEPPPPVVTQAARQAAQAGAVPVQPTRAEPSGQVMRASTAPSAAPPPTSTSDDPIARFANHAE
ncbi:NlpC/P60 family protein [Trinickia sp.]|uniref:C40 family peptidase n=1 Tax=Trinickia sp. TaxID=2571163 RepID=UPI003F7D99D1